MFFSAGTGKYRAAQEVPVLARAGVPDLDLLLRRIRLHDDAPVRGRDPDALLRAALHAADQAALQLKVSSES